MKAVVIGGTGPIGSQIVENLNAHGHDVTPAAPQTGTNTITHDGVEDAVTGAKVLIGPGARLASTTYDDWTTANGS